MYGVDASEQPQRMPHGYCNDTVHHDDAVIKRFTGPDAAARASTEVRALRAAFPTVPVPQVKAASDAEITCEFVPGVHGQDLIGPDTAARLLAECGRVLATIHAVPVAAVQAEPHPAGVLIHGDFGPQNMLFDKETLTVAAVLDWEWAHIGQPLEDLAWCEWIVRSHHADCVDALPHLYHGYGAPMPPWPRRQAAMLGKCRAMRQFGARRQDGSATVWQRRTAITQAWRE
ncbi:phosphotransferase family protein [Stackebrandtia nassauensis]|uniref:Aminoglycoside phosphotransferase n=1 Tax=Stackebrandtia nassauensis (strain DSM 44728 / CIP 108903 / NRRL B-16338 / NBRC 102104 / LLR-40K-21) TaxID=446470 RepID=D3PW63_STANL|nr:phosphotransferase [Stackebrandtia nassauensis]ADD41220.1 aminoglycoside phosphotransferase [Stackebrandtia nassauensis DSM 44728]